MRVLAIMIGSVLASVVGGALGLAAGIWWVRGSDPIFPVPQTIGLLGGLIAGPPLFLGGYFLWEHGKRK